MLPILKKVWQLSVRKAVRGLPQMFLFYLFFNLGTKKTKQLYILT